MNTYGQQRIPFLFILDFELLYPQVIRLEAELTPARSHRLWPQTPGALEILFDVRGFTNVRATPLHLTDRIMFEKFPVSFDEYRHAFDQVIAELNYGNTFLLNLTSSSPVHTNLSLKEIFLRSNAPYKLYVEDSFVVFSPETFVRIRDNRIFSYPMKGTIDASLPNAEKLLLESPKETAEHTTIVDLIRNDLSIVSDNVTVNRFRYIEPVKTLERTLLQMSSEISGDLPDGYHGRLGDILYALLPAGSISGAPKKKTLEIIKAVESHGRGYFTGVFGYYNGKDLDCGVMIRFIEKQGEQLVFKSGGGITAQSNCAEEYQEMVAKVYLPIY